jgi:flavin reductase (DIM6/NTAB) family NADH-FMN oxidoreductase RutF
MTAAWTHHVSYDPPFIMVNIEPEDATVKNILETREFGVNIASNTQNILASVSGRYSAKGVNKIELLKELGFEFYEKKESDIPMVKGAVLNAKLKLIKHEVMGDHIIFIGEVIESTIDETASPIAYHAGKYWKVGETIQKPEQKILDKIEALAQKHKKL